MNGYGADKFEIIRRIRREIKRREQVAAFALSDNKLVTWDEALDKLCRITVVDDISPLKVLKQLHTRFSRLASVPVGDKAFMDICSSSGKRNFRASLLTVKIDGHPLIDEPNCLIGQYHSFTVTRQVSQTNALNVGAVLSQHALFRIQERTDIKMEFILNSMLLMTLFSIVLKRMPLNGDDREILIKLDDVVFVGCVRAIGDRQRGRVGNLIDIRTVLSPDMLAYEQLIRAEHVGNLVTNVFIDLEGTDEAVQSLVLPLAKPDYVSMNSQTIEQLKNKYNNPVDM